jgi:glucokinase
LAGIGVGLPGAVDVEKGVVHYLTNIPGWRNVLLRSLLHRHFRLPVFLDNDANVMALAESSCGAARGYSHAVCLTLGTGVGAGLILNKRLFRGARFAAGEVGHIPIERTGMRCNCGGHGCLETFVGNAFILHEARRIFGAGITLERLSTMASGGNGPAQRLWKSVGASVGMALVGVVNLLNPEVIVIGGGVANAGGVLFSAIRTTIRTRAMNIPAQTVVIKRALLGADAGLIGAGLLPFFEKRSVVRA